MVPMQFVTVYVTLHIIHRQANLYNLMQEQIFNRSRHLKMRKQVVIDL